jgi:hypothetical protein
MSEVDERIQAHAGLLNEQHASTRSTVKHPRRDLDAVAALASVELAHQHAAMGLRRASDGQLLVEQRVPAVTYAVGFRRFGFLGIVFGCCIIAHAHHRRSMGSQIHIRS